MVGLTGICYVPHLVARRYAEITERFERGSKQNIRKYNPNEPELTYFGNERKVAPQSEYDLYFAFSRPVRFDRKKTRDNRHNMQEIRNNIFEQEKHKPIPATTSLQYGRPCRPFYDMRPSFRRADQMSDFYRRNGVLIKSKDLSLEKTNETCL